MKEKDEHIENPFEEIKDGNPFRVPQNYFETFEERLIARIKKEELFINHRRRLMFYLKPILAVAAILIIGLMILTIPDSKLLRHQQEGIVKLNSNTEKRDYGFEIPQALILDLSEEQFLTDLEIIENLDSKLIPQEHLIDFITDSYSEYEILAAN